MNKELNVSDVNNPEREKYLESVKIRGQTIHNSTIDLRAYDPSWPERYTELEKIIKKCLKENIVQIEHAGSTSVPGLSAKPVIDIVLIVEDSSKEKKYVPQLEKNGFFLRIREPEWFEHRVLKTHEKDCNLHVFSRECIEAERMLAFRDHLRVNEEHRLLYENTKKELASKTWKFVQEYADKKTDVVQEIMKHVKIREY